MSPTGVSARPRPNLGSGSVVSVDTTGRRWLNNHRAASVPTARHEADPRSYRERSARDSRRGLLITAPLGTGAGGYIGSNWVQCHLAEVDQMVGSGNPSTSTSIAG
jgi:hypothetical protein